MHTNQLPKPILSLFHPSELESVFLFPAPEQQKPPAVNTLTNKQIHVCSSRVDSELLLR